jgi:hypothetical protein
MSSDNSFSQAPVSFCSKFFVDGETRIKDIFEEFDPDSSGNIDYITWSMMLSPKVGSSSEANLPSCSFCLQALLILGSLSTTLEGPAQNCQQVPSGWSTVKSMPYC